MDNKPKVSICIPVYNGSPYIAESIDSVLAQTYEDFTLTICDNCSTDNTEDIVRGYADSRVRYVRNEKNIGPIGNTNRCLDLATGEYVCIWHHDDVMLPDNLGLKIKLLEDNRDVGFVHSNLMLIDPRGKVLAENMWAKETRSDYIKGGSKAFRDFLDLYPYSSSIFIGTVLARRSCYETTGPFDHDFPHCYDGEMWMRMLLYFRVACIGAALVKYRVHPASESSSWGDYNSLPYLREHFQVVDKFFQRFGPRIPEARSLRKQSARAFADRALTLACAALDAGKAPAGRAFIQEALNYDRRVVKTGNFWKTAAHQAAGSGGMRFCRKIRNRIVGQPQHDNA
jgi:glycosyltransferase involved in cell wall biosynthesis